MSSKFKPRTTRRKPPPWCHPGMYPMQKAFIPQGPSYVVAFALIYDSSTTPPQKLRETFLLQWNATANAWVGESAPRGWRIKLMLKPTIVDGEYDIFSELWEDGIMIDDVSWHGFEISDINRFDTLEQRVIWAWPDDYYCIRMIA